MENVIKEIEMIRQFIETEWEKENPDYRKISFYEDSIRSLKETYIEEEMF
jgi:hypothetical protein